MNIFLTEVNLHAHAGTIGPPARKHGQAVPPGGDQGGAACIKSCLGWFRTLKEKKLDMIMKNLFFYSIFAKEKENI